MSYTSSEDKMHGSIFVFLKRFVESTYDFSTWVRLTEQAGIAQPAYRMNEMYPVSEMYAIINAASALTGLSVYELQEQFGKALVPDLLLIYQKYINPAWKTFEMLQETELVMHGAVRREDSRTNPPVLHVAKANDNLLIIDYYSKRKMAGVAIGIIKGIAAHYQESDRIKILPVTEPDAERVQIRVAFT